MSRTGSRGVGISYLAARLAVRKRMTNMIAAQIAPAVAPCCQNLGLPTSQVSKAVTAKPATPAITPIITAIKIRFMLFVNRIGFQNYSLVCVVQNIREGNPMMGGNDVGQRWW